MPLDELEKVLLPPSKRTLAADVCDRLREAIYRGQLVPNQRLREETLAEFLQVSRGPIREALAQLEREGLVIRQPNRGATVAWLSLEDLTEVYSLRLALEQLAIREAIRHAEPQHLANLQGVVDEMATAVKAGLTPEGAALLDVRFHEIIYQAAKHRRLYSCWTLLRPQIHIFLLARTVANPDFHEQIVSAHQSILDAIRDKDEERACALSAEQFSAAYDRISKSYRKDVAAPGDSRDIH